MSGGHFDYDQYRIGGIADEIDRLIQINDSTELDNYGQERGYHFTPETITKFQQALLTLRMAKTMVQRIDWLVSGDDGEESFHRRWNQEMAQSFSHEAH